MNSVTVKVSGGTELRSLLASLGGEDLERNVMRGAMRAAAKVIADEARATVSSDRVRSSIKQGSDTDGYQVYGYVRTSGKGSFLAPWLEYGVAPHLIAKRGGPRAIDGISITRASKSAQRHADGSLKIGGNFVGQVVKHPGIEAAKFSFMRPALDTKKGEAMEAAASYVQSRLTKEGLKAADAGGDE